VELMPGRHRDALRRALRSWVDTGAADPVPSDPAASRRIDWLRVAPFLGLHLACLGAFWTGTSGVAFATAAALYALRMFAITAFYHRYCSHRAFAVSRTVQFLLALLAASAGQRGPLWWASHHRHHHLHADRPGDAHSALRDGFLWSHVGWFLARENFAARRELVADLARYPELRFLDRFDVLAPLGLAALLYAAGELAAALAPGLSVTGPQLVVWGFCISTVALCHATFTINSLAHRFGSRRYATADDSRNNLWLALLTLGEGWHNNHHHFPGSARQGFRWYELDLTYYLLRLLAGLGLVSNLREVPAAVLHARRPGRAGPPQPSEEAA
jgi:stearoyl-CoA desaturase (delta-9 desaturase)